MSRPPLMQPVRVKASARALDGFVSDAKQIYPKEVWGAVFGRRQETPSGLLVEVEEVWVPDNIADFTTPTAVYWDPEWWALMEEHADDSGLDLVGDIHSHPNHFEDLSPSEIDLKGSRWRALMGIVGVRRRGRGLQTRVQWWGPTAPVETIG